MAYVDVKEIPKGSGNYYKYLHRSYRDENGTVKTEYLCYLGKADGKKDRSISRKEVPEGVSQDYDISYEEERRISDEAERIIDKVESIDVHGDIQEVHLFGSRRTDESDQYSDYDFLIIRDDNPEESEGAVVVDFASKFTGVVDESRAKVDVNVGKKEGDNVMFEKEDDEWESVETVKVYPS